MMTTPRVLIIARNAGLYALILVAALTFFIRILPSDWLPPPPWVRQTHVAKSHQSDATTSRSHAQQKAQTPLPPDPALQRAVTVNWVAPGVFVTTMIAVISILALALRKQSLWIYSAALLLFGLYQSPLALADLIPTYESGNAGYFLFSGLECFALLFLWFGLSYLDLLSDHRAKVAVWTCFVCMAPLQMFKNFFPQFINVFIFSWAPFFVLIAILAIIKSRSGFRPAPYLATGSLGIAACWYAGGYALFAWGGSGQSIPAWTEIPWFTVGLIWLTAFIFGSISDGVVAANRKALQVTLRYAEAARRFVPDDFLRALGHTDIDRGAAWRPRGARNGGSLLRHSFFYESFRDDECQRDDDLRERVPRACRTDNTRAWWLYR